MAACGGFIWCTSQERNTANEVSRLENKKDERIQIPEGLVDISTGSQNTNGPKNNKNRKKRKTNAVLVPCGDNDNPGDSGFMCDDGNDASSVMTY
jgi:hypothetical protein